MADKGLHTLRDSQMKLCEVVQQRFYCTPEAGTTLEELGRPEFWAHVCQKVAQHAEIIVVPEDTSFYARFFVLGVGTAYLQVALLEHVVFNETASEEEESDYEIRFQGSIAKHRVYRKSDGQMMAEGIALKADAVKWIADHVAAQRPKAA